NELEPTHNGRYVVIEVDSRRYYIGNTRDEAITGAKKIFPNKIMFVKKIGGIEKASRHSSSPSHVNYARLL
ncbi:MAG: hypothetical protein AAB972_02915, partial [Patescibacteria group bacterium]